MMIKLYSIRCQSQPSPVIYIEALMSNIALIEPTLIFKNQIKDHCWTSFFTHHSGRVSSMILFDSRQSVKASDKEKEQFYASTNME